MVTQIIVVTILLDQYYVLCISPRFRKFLLHLKKYIIQKKKKTNCFIKLFAVGRKNEKNTEHVKYIFARDCWDLKK